MFIFLPFLPFNCKCCAVYFIAFFRWIGFFEIAVYRSSKFEIKLLEKTTGTGIFDKKTGKSISIIKNVSPQKYQDVFGKTIVELAAQNEKIIGKNYQKKNE